MNQVEEHKGTYNLTPYGNFDKQCEEAINGYVDFNVHPEKYHPDHKDTARASVMDACMNDSRWEWDPNFKMFHMVVDILKEVGCTDGLTDEQINKLTPSDTLDCIMNYYSSQR